MACLQHEYDTFHIKQDVGAGQGLGAVKCLIEKLMIEKASFNSMFSLRVGPRNECLALIKLV